MKETLNKKEKDSMFYRLTSRISLVLLVSVALITLLGIIHNARIHETLEGVTDVQEMWTDSAGEGLSLWKVNELDDCSVYLTLDTIGNNQTLIFNSRNLYVDVSINGELVSKDDFPDYFIFGKTTGNKWHTIALEKSSEKTVIELKLKHCYKNSGYIRNVYVGDELAIRKTIFQNKIWIFLLSSFWAVVGVVMVCLYAVFHDYFRLEKDFLYLAAGTYFCAQWCSIETGLWQFLLGDSSYFHFLAYVTMVALPIPFALLAKSKLSGRWKFFANIYAFLTELNMVFLSFLHISGICEFHNTIIMNYVLLFLLLPFAVATLKAYSQGDNIKKVSKVLNTCFAILVISTSIGIVKYITHSYSDYLNYVIVSMFCFILLLMIYEALAINEMFVKGLTLEFEQEMARTDHLTKFYNRSGFAYNRNEYDRADHPIGVIQFDVNNLKKVNDSLGHEMGDELICQAASCIRMSFGSEGARYYRMGGDEFMVILYAGNPREIYEEGLKQLQVYCDMANSVEDKKYELSIACGFAVKEVGESLNDCTGLADQRMYENKKKMKENMA